MYILCVRLIPARAMPLWPTTCLRTNIVFAESNIIGDAVASRGAIGQVLRLTGSFGGPARQFVKATYSFTSVHVLYVIYS